MNIGDRIGDYEIVGILGAGGMGKVYKVRNVISDRVEAIKVLLPELANVPELADRFLREIKVLAGLEHPNIAALRTAQRIDNQLVMVMELVEGVTLEERLKSGPIPVPEALDYIAQVLSALSYAHGRGVIHRDIKPANMMVTEGGVVKLMDFGIAKAAGDRKLTMTGTTMGSLYYMSPEQIKGTELDPRSDLYSLGVALYEIVTGARPFKGDSDFSIMSAHLEKMPQAPIEVDPKLPAVLNEIILMSIAKDPAKRFQSAKAFGAAIQSIRGGVPVAAPAAARAQAPAAAPAAAPVAKPSPQPVGAPPPRPPSSHRGLYMALGAIVMVLVLVAGAMTIPKWLRTRAGGSPAPAQESAAPITPGEQTLPPQPAATEPAATQAGTPAAVSQPAAVMGGTTRAPQASTTKASGLPSQPPAQRQAQPVTPQQLPPQTQAPAAQAAPSQPAQAPAVDQAKLAALKEVQKSWPLLASRAGAVSTSLQNLQRQQQRSGLGLRGDITAQWKQMEFYMDQLEAAISAKDADAAKENMDNAERTVSALEKFLGR